MLSCDGAAERRGTDFTCRDSRGTMWMKVRPKAEKCVGLLSTSYAMLRIAPLVATALRPCWGEDVISRCGCEGRVPEDLAAGFMTNAGLRRREAELISCAATVILVGTAQCG